MPDLDFPVSVAAITPEWLTLALGGACALGDARVSGFDIEPVGAGVGFMATVCRLALRYDGDPGSAPRSIIAKLPSPDPGAQMISSTFKFYEKEVRFYEQVAAVNSMRSPRAYHQKFDAASGDFALLLEDLAPARNGDQVAGLTVGDAATAVAALARMQAQWWEKPELRALDWLPPFNDVSMQALDPVFQQCWEPYKAFLGDSLPAELIPVGDRLATMIIPMLHQFMEKPCTFVHGDFRADNFFFYETPTSLTVVDWQIVLRGPGMFDLAYLLAGNLSVEDRRAAEGELVRLYHDTLLAGGVTGYDWETCWRDYRTFVLFGWLWPVIAIGSLDTANERGVAFFREWSRRVCTAILDLNAAETLTDFRV
ncbi:MAG: phosphotransferase [Caulobacterales bacterium]